MRMKMQGWRMVMAGGLLLGGSTVLAQGYVEGGAAADDPANLKGERVPAVELEPLSVDQGAKGLEGMLKKLATRASLLMIVAHPDDEDGGMLTYESRGAGARVGMLTLTRGEGGQNVMSGDFNDALGLVRTRELLAADLYLGVNQMFGTEVDFGFSKTKEEAFRQWTHERVLYDAVRAVRLYRPLVVTSVFIGGPTDGHGQHQVSGEMAQEVFTAAADPKVFPEMGLPVWAPAKVYARVPFAQVDGRGMFDYATGKWVPARFYNYVTKVWSTKAPEATVMVPEGEPSSLLGASYVQFARMGLALQKTQIGSGMRTAPAGRFDVGYTRYGSRVKTAGGTESSMFEGVDVSLAGIADLAGDVTGNDRATLRASLTAIEGKVRDAGAALGSGSPETVAPLLRDGLVATRALIAQVEQSKWPARERYDVLHELRVKEVQFQQALVDALELHLQVEATPAAAKAKRRPAIVAGDVIRGQELRVGTELRHAQGTEIEVKDETARFAHGMEVHTWEKGPATQQTAEETSLAVRVAPDAGFTRPYFTRKDLEQPFYDVLDPRLRNAPTTPAALTVWKTVRYGGVPVVTGAVVKVNATKTGETAQPLQVVPTVRVSVAPRYAIVPKGKDRVPVQVVVGMETYDAAGATVRMEVPGGWRVEPKAEQAQPGDGSEGAMPPFAVGPVQWNETQQRLTAVATVGGKEYREGFHAVGYPGITRDNLFEAAAVQARGVDVTVPAGLKVAYLPGTGDAVEETFAQIGVAATTVSVADIAAGRLAGYDALVLGVRAYAAHKDLGAATAKLMEFAKAGGVVVVQYNTAEFNGADAPYPLSLGTAEKVVEEKAPVRLLVPEAQVLRWPNRITERDFDGWTEERGHGFMGEWDPKYVAVTEVHDAGQDPQKGGLLVAPVGNGAYVYCAYALYRQLPEGVPGAFRLLANMVSLGRRP